MQADEHINSITSSEKGVVLTMLTAELKNCSL